MNLNNQLGARAGSNPSGNIPLGPNNASNPAGSGNPVGANAAAPN